jgi:hypothetical protein
MSKSTILYQNTTVELASTRLRTPVGNNPCRKYIVRHNYAILAIKTNIQYMLIDLLDFDHRLCYYNHKRFESWFYFRHQMNGVKKQCAGPLVETVSNLGQFAW